MFLLYFSLQISKCLTDNLRLLLLKLAFVFTSNSQVMSNILLPTHFSKRTLQQEVAVNDAASKSKLHKLT